MRKVLLLIIGTAVLCVPTVSIAGALSPRPSSRLAAKTETPGATNDVRNPAGTCGGQRNGPAFAASHDGQSFAQFYGTNSGNGRGAGGNAFGKCVSTLAKHTPRNDRKTNAERHAADSAEGHGKDGGKSHARGNANPAMTCKAMQASDRAHFQATYGIRPNAFGNCVAGQANDKG
jgi:hypothetical protein